MKRILQFLLSVSFTLVLLLSISFTNVSQAQITKPQEDVKGSITIEEAIEKANFAISEAEFDLTQLPLLETNAALVYNDGNSNYEWIVSYIVENEAEPYLLATMDALSGEVTSIVRTNYFELYDQWELQQKLPHELWPLEELILFNSLYRRSDLLPQYTLPSQNDIAKETAIQMSEKALRAMFDVSDAFLSKYECSAVLMQDVGNLRKWNVYYCTIASPTQANVQYQVTIDATNGEILLCEKN